MEDYIIYADGVYSMKHNEGAYSFIVLDKDGRVYNKAAQRSVNESNNRMELKAVISAIQSLPMNVNVVVHSDSTYTINTLSGKWGRKANEDLFPIYDDILLRRNIHVTFEWVKEHGGNPIHEECSCMCEDILGYDASREYLDYKKNKI